MVFEMQWLTDAVGLNRSLNENTAITCYSSTSVTETVYGQANALLQRSFDTVAT